jgi:hypothetical protein
MSLAHGDLTPGAGGDAMISEESGWNCVFVPLRAGSNQGQAVGEFSAIAQRTPEGRPQSRSPPFFAQHPLAKLERRTVAYMLAMTARQLGNPLTVLVTMETGDGAFDGPR